jgi:hypothetical protein
VRDKHDDDPVHRTWYSDGTAWRVLLWDYDRPDWKPKDQHKTCATYGIGTPGRRGSRDNTDASDDEDPGLAQAG